MRKLQKQPRLNEQGLVSIIVTMILMIVISLIVVGFAQLARREQRQALDRQLNSQAFYAAESGVNDAVHAIKLPPPFTYTAQKTSCGPDATGPLSSASTGGSPGAQLDSSSGVGYTCLLIDQQPLSLDYQTIDTEKAPTVMLHSVKDDGSGADNPLNTLTISWKNTTGAASYETTDFPNFPKSGAWVGNIGLLRIALTDTGGAVDRDSLINSTFTAYLYPQPGGLIATTPYVGGAGNLSNQGKVISGSCHPVAPPALDCSVTITGLNILSSSHLVLRLKSLYQPVSVRVTGTGSNPSGPIRFQGAQALIDSTGKANDVLRRIQVRVPLSDTSDYPQYLLESADSICKTLELTPSAPPTFDASDPACDPGP